MEKVKIAVYDCKGAFIGYKLDTCWTLDTEAFKQHTLENGEIREVLLKNLVYLLDGEFKDHPDSENCIAQSVKESKITVSVQTIKDSKQLASYEVFLNESNVCEWRKV